MATVYINTAGTAWSGTAGTSWTDVGTTGSFTTAYPDYCDWVWTTGATTNTITVDSTSWDWEWIGTSETVEPLWQNLNETQEEKEQRERRYFIRTILHHGTQITGAQIDEDPAFDFERVVNIARQFQPSRFAAYQHVLPLTDVELREVEDMWQQRREETIEYRRRQAEALLAAEELNRQKAVARRRAELFLISLLSATQQREWLEHKRVTEVAASGRIWRLFPKWAGGVCIMSEVKPEVRRATLCIHGAQRVPEEDNMAMLLMTIRADEDRMIRVGNMCEGLWTGEENEIRRIRQADVDAAVAA